MLVQDLYRADMIVLSNRKMIQNKHLGYHLNRIESEVENGSIHFFFHFSDLVLWYPPALKLVLKGLIITD